MQKILDEAAQDFAKKFYRCLIQGDTIQVAFDRAKEFVESVQHH